MKVEQDYILTFSEEEWTSFPKELQQTLFVNYGEYVNRFTEFTDCEEDNSIQIAQNYFLCALEESGIWEIFMEWLEERDYYLFFNFWDSPGVGVIIDD